MKLSSEASAAGHRLFSLAEVGSTMDEARALVAAGEREPFWVVADSQSRGRGRHGRAWYSPPGNLYATLALAEPCEPARGPELGFVAGIALHRAISAAAGLRHPALAIKWPNDLLLEDAKVAGLLLEGLTFGGRFRVLIGFGVNVSSAPTDTPYPARALGPAAAGVTPGAVLYELSREIVAALSVHALGFASIRADWLARAARMGQEARVRLPSGEVAGVMSGVDESGRLLLRTSLGMRTIDAGDLFFGH